MTEEVNTKFANSTEQIEVAIRSINPIIWVKTHEEHRLISEIVNLGGKLKMDVYAWSLWQGLVPVSQYNNGERASGAFEKTWQPPTALDKIAQLEAKKPKRGNIVIMRDPHVAMQEPIPRQLRDLYKLLIERQTKLVFVSPMLAHGAGGNAEGLPPTLEKQITVIDFALPTQQELDDVIRKLVHGVIDRNAPKAGSPQPTAKAQETVDNLSKLTKADFQEFSKAVQGLTIAEAENAASASIQHCKTISTQFLNDNKKQILAKGDILEYFEANRTMKDIGGMDLMKSFFDDYKECHSEAAQEFGIEPLKGVLMVGIPGCGKSQMCKAVATAWKLPLVRLDVGKVMTGLVGGSESKMRAAIRQVEAIAPCVLWIDEVEKALSGTKSSNFSDGGTMARVFGTLLTAMEEGLKGVTILATANDIDALPPEFIRRFSETFFVDLPGPDERKEIFSIHLRKKSADPKNFNLDTLVEKSENYTGHEIEKAVKRSLSFAWKDTHKKLKTNHVSTALEETKPLFHIMGDKISKMRAEARGKYRFASSWAKGQADKIKVKQEKLAVSDVELPKMENKKKKQAAVSDDTNLDIE